jgi:hypothetical protein
VKLGVYDLIAGALTRSGLLTGRGNRWTYERVTALRSTYHIPCFGADRCTREGWMNLTRAAAFLGISPASRVHLTIDAQRLLRTHLEAIGHHAQALDRRLALVILEGVTARASCIARYLHVALRGKERKRFCVLPLPKLESLDGAVSPKRGIPAAERLGSGIELVVNGSLNPLGELHDKEVVSLLRVLRRDDFRAYGLAGGLNRGAFG